jgi:hypothetical protein
VTRRRTILATELPGEVFTAAFRDNFELKYEGIRYGDLSSAQQKLLLDVLETYAGRIRPGHGDVRLAEVTHHLAQTCFAWMGGVDEESAQHHARLDHSRADHRH